jgi:uncharacterized repeat protein (TIGR01451 family)
MQMETIKKVLVWSLLLLVLPAVALAQNHIQLQSVAEVEKTVFNEEGQKEIKRLPAEKVLPGSEVIFTTYYENISKENVERAVITNPVPDHMVYSSGTASGLGAQITYSVDNGQSYDIPANLFVFDATGRKYPARAKDYTHIRWTFEDPLQSGTKGEVRFRAILQ